MLLRYTALIVGLWLLAQPAQTQQLVPLLQDEALQERYQRELAQLPFAPFASKELATKAACTFDLPAGVRPALSGVDTRLVISLDTSGLDGPAGAYQCVNCANLRQGTGRIDGDELVYRTNAGVITAFDTVRLTYCNSTLNRCADTVQIVVLARRADRSVLLPEISLAPEGSTVLLPPALDLPGGLFCSEIVDCADNYGGRDQLVAYRNGTQLDSQLVYRASRFGGVDSVCLRLCSEQGICDTYRFAVRVNQAVRSLPFFDDFSYPGPVTSSQYWLDRDVLVNRNYAQQPPSVGVATFDAIDRTGRPYAFSTGNISERDRLTSVPLDLAGRSGAVLTFYYQPRGLGNRPELRDSLVLQFRSQSGAWQRIAAYAGLPSSESNLSERPFQGVRIEVPGAYQYRGFQFRFGNLSDEAGALDNWNLDYVRLDDVQTELTFSDIAFTNEPSPVLDGYTAVPYRQLRAAGEALLSDTIRVGLWNHFDQPVAVLNSTLDIRELNTGLPLLNLTLFNGQEANVENGLPIERTYSLSSDPFFANQYPAYRQRILTDDALTEPSTLRLRTRYTLVNTSQITTPGLRESVLRNDTVQRITELGDYFAYDDGTAELALEPLPAQQLVQRYTAYVPETLRGVRVRFPRNTANFDQQRVRFVVYLGTLDGQPEYSYEVQPVFAETFTDSLQGLTTYALRNSQGEIDSLIIPVGDFYVGIEQISECQVCTAIGYDRNNELSDVLFFNNNGGGWFPLNGPVFGVLMLRPLVGSSTPLDTDVAEPVAKDDLALEVFPNPVGHQFFLRTRPDFVPEQAQLLLYAATGQLVLQQPYAPQVSVDHLPPGVYWLRILDGQTGKQAQRKLVISR